MSITKKKEYDSEYYKKNREQILNRNKKYDQSERGKMIRQQYRKKYYEEHKKELLEKANKRAKEWYKKNKLNKEYIKRIRQYTKEYEKRETTLKKIKQYLLDKNRTEKAKDFCNIKMSVKETKDKFIEKFGIYDYKNYIFYNYRKYINVTNEQ